MDHPKMNEFLNLLEMKTLKINNELQYSQEIFKKMIGNDRALTEFA